MVSTPSENTLPYLQDVRLNLGTRGEADSHKSSSRAEVLQRLVVASRGGACDDRSVGSLPISDPLQLLDDVFGGLLLSVRYMYDVYKE